MGTELRCEIVRDLLPSYVDGLTSEVTNRAVEAHVAACPSCAGELGRMTEPESSDLTEPTAEVDYLKKVRRKSRRSVGLIVACFACILLFVGALQIFFYGTPVSGDAVECSVTVSEEAVTEEGTVYQTLTIQGTSLDSSRSIVRVEYIGSEGGSVALTFYTAPKTFFNSNSITKSVFIPAPVNYVSVGNRFLWFAGTEVDNTVSMLYAARNPYVGDMPANLELAATLGVEEDFGPFTNELQTAEKPYGWTLNLEREIASEELLLAQRDMTRDSLLMLALIDNLGSVTWQYRTEAGSQSDTITTEDAYELLGRSIKSYGSWPYTLEELVNLLGVGDDGVEDGSLLQMHIVNGTASSLAGIELTLYADETMEEELCAVRAVCEDRELWDWGNSLEVVVRPEDLPEGVTFRDLCKGGYWFTVIEADGSEEVGEAGSAVDTLARKLLRGGLCEASLTEHGVGDGYSWGGDGYGLKIE